MSILFRYRSIVVCAIVLIVPLAVQSQSSRPDPFSAYHPVRLASRPSQPPVNTAIADQGPALTLATYPIGKDSHGFKALGFEPMVGVDRYGVAFYNARSDLGDVAGKQLNEQSIFRSTDGGVNWTDISGGPSQHYTSEDPYLYVDPDTGRVFWLDVVIGGATLSISDDQGTTWTTNHIQAIGENDHPTLTTAAPPAGADVVPTDPDFAKIVYYCTNTIVAGSCARSVDGGRTFLPIASPLMSMRTNGVCSGSQTGHMAADAEGRVYIGSQKCGPPFVSVSTDGGDSWTDVVVTDRINTTSAVNINHDDDVNLAVDGAGNVYALWLDDRDSLPYLSVSSDHGLHWQTPMMIAPPGMTAMKFASIDAGDAGRIAVSFIGTMGPSSDSTRPWSYFVAVSTDAASDNPLFTAAVATIPDTNTQIVGRGSDCCSAMKDFLSVVVAPTAEGRIWASLSDACTGACVDDPNGTSDNANIGAAFVVRQTGGPALRGDRRTLPGDVP